MPGNAARNQHATTTKGIVRALLAWFATDARDLPWRHTRDAYAIWVSEIMLQQTQVATVIPYWERWMRELPTIQAAAGAPAAKLRKLWEGLGYYTRVRNLQKAARVIVKEHGSKFSQDFDAILALPGVGRYTAGAIASIAFNDPKPILDGNVMRVLTRLFAIRANPRQRPTNTHLWQLAEDLVVEASRTARRESRIQNPESRIARLTTGPCSALNQALMELGAVICQPRQPRCETCPLRKLCAGRQRGIAQLLPSAARRTPAVPRQVALFVVRRGQRILARRRPEGGVNAHFWELPQVELTGKRPSFPCEARPVLGVEPADDKALFELWHSITRYRIRIAVFAGRLAGPFPGGRWLSLAQLRHAAFTGADRKVLRKLGLT